EAGQERRLVLLPPGHRHLQSEDLVARTAEVVGNNAAHGMGVADVHVAVDEPWRDHEVPRVDDAVGARRRELVGPPHAADASVLDEDGAVADDPALLVDADDVARVVDLEAGLRHGPAPQWPAISSREIRIFWTSLVPS